MNTAKFSQSANLAEKIGETSLRKLTRSSKNCNWKGDCCCIGGRVLRGESTRWRVRWKRETSDVVWHVRTDDAGTSLFVFIRAMEEENESMASKQQSDFYLYNCGLLWWLRGTGTTFVVTNSKKIFQCRVDVSSCSQIYLLSSLHLEKRSKRKWRRDVVRCRWIVEDGRIDVDGLQETIANQVHCWTGTHNKIRWQQIVEICCSWRYSKEFSGDIVIRRWKSSISWWKNFNYQHRKSRFEHWTKCSNQQIFKRFSFRFGFKTVERVSRRVKRKSPLIHRAKTHNDQLLLIW